MARLIKEAFRLQQIAGITPILEKKADKDYDGDGEIESSEDEYKGVKDKAIKANVKENWGEVVAIQAGKGEEDFNHGEDHEGSMAQGELKELQSNVSKLINMLGDNPQLPGWVSAYITLASDYMNSVAQYISNQSDSEDCGCN